MKEASRAQFDVQGIIMRHLDVVKQTIIQQMGVYGRNASGAHVDSLEIEATSNHGELTGLFSWNYLETGSRPWTKQPVRVPRWFREIIQQWIVDKGVAIYLVPYKDPERPHKYTVMQRSIMIAGGAIAHKIMTEGTALFRSGVPQDLFSGAINRECDAIAEEARMEVGKVIDNINKSIR